MSRGRASVPRRVAALGSSGESLFMAPNRCYRCGAVRADEGAKVRINSRGQRALPPLISLVRRLFSKLIPPIKLTKLSAPY